MADRPCRYPGDDQIGPSLRQRGIIEPKRGGILRYAVVDQHVGPGQQRIEPPAIRGQGQIQRFPRLAPVPEGIVGRRHPASMRRINNLHHIRTGLGQHQRRERPCAPLRQIDDADTVQYGPIHKLSLFSYTVVVIPTGWRNRKAAQAYGHAPSGPVR